jgi:uncharacterized membrane protein
MKRGQLERLTIGSLALYAAGSAYVVVRLLLAEPVTFELIAACTLAFFVFAVLHSTLTLGSQHSVAFVVISFSICLLSELLGTSRGWIFGPYYYTDLLGPKFQGLVPVVIPLAWFMMMYSSYALANALVCGCGGAPGTAGRQADNGARASWLRLLWLVFLSAMIMTSWDLVNDPINVAGGNWVWMEKGAYFGIPLSNYAGWFFTTFVVYLLYRLYERVAAPEDSQVTDRSFALLPMLAYAVTMLANVGALTLNGQTGPALVGLFSMGAFLAAFVSLRFAGARA